MSTWKPLDHIIIALFGCRVLCNISIWGFTGRINTLLLSATCSIQQSTTCGSNESRKQIKTTKLVRLGAL
jgi:hypothetical protein